VASAELYTFVLTCQGIVCMMDPLTISTRKQGISLITLPADASVFPTIVETVTTLTVSVDLQVTPSVVQRLVHDVSNLQILHVVIEDREDNYEVFPRQGSCFGNIPYLLATEVESDCTVVRVDC
jgi:hypothetical protein